MGATASRSSFSPPSSRVTVNAEHSSTTPPSPATTGATAKTEYTETRRFKITEFSESALLPPGSTLTLDTFQFRGQGWRVDLKPVGGPTCLDTITVSISIVADHGWNSPENTRTRVLIDILDERGERAVFEHHLTHPEKTEGFGFLAVNKAELEAASCIRDDSLTVRCTLSVDVFLGPEVDATFTAEAGMKANMRSLHRETAPTVRTPRTGAAASVTAKSSSSASAKSHIPQPPCGFGWLAGGRLRRRRFRDAFGIHRYRRLESSIGDASTGNGSDSDRTPRLSAVYV